MSESPKCDFRIAGTAKWVLDLSLLNRHFNQTLAHRYIPLLFICRLQMWKIKTALSGEGLAAHYFWPGLQDFSPHPISLICLQLTQIKRQANIYVHQPPSPCLVLAKPESKKNEIK